MKSWMSETLERHHAKASALQTRESFCEDPEVSKEEMHNDHQSQPEKVEELSQFPHSPDELSS